MRQCSLRVHPETEREETHDGGGEGGERGRNTKVRGGQAGI